MNDSLVGVICGYLQFKIASEARTCREMMSAGRMGAIAKCPAPRACRMYILQMILAVKAWERTEVQPENDAHNNLGNN